MIIKNNFNKDSAEPLKDYHQIGKTDDYDDNNFIRENNNNEIIQDIYRKDHEFDEDDDSKEDKWDFFR